MAIERTSDLEEGYEQNIQAMIWGEKRWKTQKQMCKWYTVERFYIHVFGGQKEKEKTK